MNSDKGVMNSIQMAVILSKSKTEVLLKPHIGHTQESGKVATNNLPNLHDQLMKKSVEATEEEIVNTFGQ